MADLLAFKTRRRIDEEASLWLSRLDRGLAADERAQLGEWLAADARHGRALVAMAALWDDMELLRELSGLLELPPRSRPSTPVARWPWIALGAAVPLALLALFLLRPQWPPGTGTAAAAASPSPATGAEGGSGGAGTSAPGEGSAYATRLGEQRTEVLADGSIVKLNTSTRIRVAFGARERRVEVVSGEAHFEVQHDAARPFVVSAAGRRIRALGTAFNVRLARDGALRLTVTEGRVVVTRPAGAAPSAPGGAPARAEVVAGEQLLAAGAGELGWTVQPLPPETLANHLAWQRGMLVFDGEPLEDALAEVARYGEVRFEIPDERLRRMRIGGVYKSGDIDGLVRSLERNFDLVVTRGPGGRIVVSGR
jgi:transmembrane sensor